MNLTLKRYLISSLTTFLSTFLLTLALLIKTGIPMEVTLPFISAMIMTAFRAAAKAVIESFLPQSLGLQAGADKPAR